MRITCDPAADALYISLRAARPDDSRDIEDGVTVDVDAEGHLIGIEILDAQTQLGPEALTSVALERLPLDTTPANQ